MTDPRTPDEPRLDQLLEEASLWFARMRGPEADSYRPDFDAWLARGAAHLGAYNRAAEIFSMGKFLSEPGQGVVREDPPLRARRWPKVILLASMGLAVMMATWLMTARPALLGFGAAPQIARTGRNTDPATLKLSTAPGRRHAFRLSDGSSVALLEDSVVMVTFGASERSLHLTRGRARFDVAHESRAFVVYAGGGSVTAHGTIFDVAVDARRRVTVRLLRGAIDVALPLRTTAPRRLLPGQVLRFAGDEPSPMESRLRGATALPPNLVPGAVEYDDTPLSDLVADANRADRRQLAVADPTLGELRVSGRFSVEDPERLAERVAALEDLTVDRSDPNHLILRRR